jgi:hypothetical protein
MISQGFSIDAHRFGEKNEEKGDFNQYWYSPYTIQKIVEEVVLIGGKTALLSTPSIYFSIPEEHRGNSYVFDVSDNAIVPFHFSV